MTGLLYQDVDRAIGAFVRKNGRQPSTLKLGAIVRANVIMDAPIHNLEILPKGITYRGVPIERLTDPGEAYTIRAE